MSEIDDVIEGNIKKHERVLTGLYLEPDIARVLDSLGKKGGRGTKSKIANEALRNLFKEKGLLD